MLAVDRRVDGMIFIELVDAERETETGWAHHFYVFDS
jgi:hypothetical protein